MDPYQSAVSSTAAISTSTGSDHPEIISNKSSADTGTVHTMDPPSFSDPASLMESVTIIVGSKDPKPILAYKKFLTWCSPYFQKALDGPFVEAQTQTVRLEHVEPHVFSLFISWAYTNSFRTQHLASAQRQDISPGERQAKAYEQPPAQDLVELWILADYLQVPHLQNYTIEHLWWKMGRLNCQVDIYNLVYEKTVSGSPLRRMIVGKVDNVGMEESYIKNNPNLFPPEFLYDLALLSIKKTNIYKDNVHLKLTTNVSDYKIPVRTYHSRQGRGRHVDRQGKPRRR